MKIFSFVLPFPSISQLAFFSELSCEVLSLTSRGHKSSFNIILYNVASLLLVQRRQYYSKFAVGIRFSRTETVFSCLQYSHEQISLISNAVTLHHFIRTCHSPGSSCCVLGKYPVNSKLISLSLCLRNLSLCPTVALTPCSF